MLILSLQVCHGENTCPQAPAAMPALGGARRPLLHWAKEAPHPPSGRRSLPMKALSSMTTMNCHARRRWVSCDVRLAMLLQRVVNSLGLACLGDELASLLLANSCFLGVLRPSPSLLILYDYNQHKAGRFTRSWAIPSRSPPALTNHIAEVWISIIYSFTSSCPPRVHFPRDFPSKVWYACLASTMLAMYPTHRSALISVS